MLSESQKHLTFFDWVRLLFLKKNHRLKELMYWMIKENSRLRLYRSSLLIWSSLSSSVQLLVSLLSQLSLCFAWSARMALMVRWVTWRSLTVFQMEEVHLELHMFLRFITIIFIRETQDPQEQGLMSKLRSGHHHLCQDNENGLMGTMSELSQPTKSLKLLKTYTITLNNSISFRNLFTLPVQKWYV